MRTTTTHRQDHIGSDLDQPLHVEVWGSGTRVVMIHGSLATGADEWQAQRPLADIGFELVIPDRRGYGASPTADGEDFLVDAADIADLMGGGAHLVGHSYGGLGAMYAAANNPTATLSLTLLEPAAISIATHDPSVRAFDEAVRTVWALDLPDDEWVARFLQTVGTDPSELPADLLDAATAMVPVFRRGRPYFDAAPPVDEVAQGQYPKLVVSGGYDPAWETLCTELADRIGADRAVVGGAGHEIQFVGEPLNELLSELWGS
jgi:pimeloyl-ACP methyl ester carboxylesterase